MKKVYLIITILFVSFAFLNCTSSTRNTSEEVVSIIETLEINEIDQTFHQELQTYIHRGDAYYLLGEENDYIELVMYYKQKYVQLIMEFEVIDGKDLIVEQINVEYFDLRDEIYVNFNTYDDENTYILNNITYHEFFNDLEALSFSDIEWILASLDLM